MGLYTVCHPCLTATKIFSVLEITMKINCLSFDVDLCGYLHWRKNLDFLSSTELKWTWKLALNAHNWAENSVVNLCIHPVDCLWFLMFVCSLYWFLAWPQKSPANWVIHPGYIIVLSNEMISCPASHGTFWHKKSRTALFAHFANTACQTLS